MRTEIYPLDLATYKPSQDGWGWVRAWLEFIHEGMGGEELETLKCGSSFVCSNGFPGSSWALLPSSQLASYCCHCAADAVGRLLCFRQVQPDSAFYKARTCTSTKGAWKLMLRSTPDKGYGHPWWHFSFGSALRCQPLQRHSSSIIYSWWTLPQPCFMTPSSQFYSLGSPPKEITCTRAWKPLTSGSQDKTNGKERQEKEAGGGYRVKRGFGF